MNSRKMKWVEHVTCMGEMRNAYKILVGRPEVKRPLGRSRRRCEDNLRMALVTCGGIVWTEFMLLRMRTSGGLF